MNYRRIFTSFFALILVTIVTVAPVIAQESELACLDIHRDLFLATPMLRGADVLELQERLAELGFDPGKADGVFGNQTEEAIIELQQENNLLPTGVATMELWDKIAQLQGTEISATVGEVLAKPQGQVSIVINTDKKRLTVFDDDKIHVEFPVAVGKYNTPSPIGEWRIIQKSANRGGALGSRWMRLNVPWGTYGIHGTNKPYSIGSNASLGCIRMYNKDVEKLYEIIPHGTPVKIVSESYPQYPPGFKKRSLKEGMMGPDVVEMQQNLKNLGILWGRADSRFGGSTKMFVKRFQAMTGQEITGEFNKDDYEALEKLAWSLSPDNKNR
ncbi:MAG: peptidoglycan-binding protein [Bacillota bacterium]|nr:peptidoglycan-binding protein [Bacillota bacterium]